MTCTYKTCGTCSTAIDLTVEEGVVQDVVFHNGCNGNLQGIARLVRGMQASEVIARLEGIRCGKKTTSCPDQLCQALHAMGW